MAINKDQPMGGHDEKPSSQSTKSPERPKGPSRPEPRLLEQVRNVMRLHHYSTRSGATWIDQGISVSGPFWFPSFASVTIQIPLQFRNTVQRFNGSTAFSDYF
jgi:hypothetical protein